MWRGKTKWFAAAAAVFIAGLIGVPVARWAYDEYQLTRAEQAYCLKNPKRYFEHLAGRFAAKEAVLKVLGTGWRGGIAWTDVEVIKEPSGQPRILLAGECERIAHVLGIAHWHLSISHIETHATASAIGMRGE